MRTTLDLDTDVLVVVKHLAMERKQSLGVVISTLLREGFQPRQETETHSSAIPVLPRKPGAQPVTSQMVRDLMDQDV